MTVDWTAALCKADPDFHFSRDAADVAYARRVCGMCPIKAACLQRALDSREPLGMWGGMTPGERGRLLNTRGVQPTPIRHDLILHVKAGAEKFSALSIDEQVLLWRQHLTTRQAPNVFLRRYRISGSTLRRVQAAADLATDTPARRTDIPVPSRKAA